MQVNGQNSSFQASRHRAIISVSVSRDASVNNRLFATVTLSQPSAATGSQSPTKSQSVAARQEAGWYASTGKGAFATISAGVQQITNDLSSGDYIDMQKVCTSFAGQIQTLQGEPPIPIPAMEQTWQQVLTQVGQGVTECANGDILNFPTVIESAVAPLSALQNEIVQANS
jgi:hypothetical protein